MTSTVDHTRTESATRRAVPSYPEIVRIMAVSPVSGQVEERVSASPSASTAGDIRLLPIIPA